jgi:transposase-like protein
MRTGILKCPSCKSQQECEMVGGEPPRSNGKVYFRLYKCLKCGRSIEREVGSWRKPSTGTA